MIGERIKRARAATGLSMQALGEQVGISANMIKKYEHGVSMPGSAMFIKLGKALGEREHYGFKNKSEVVRTAIDRLQEKLIQQRLVYSSEIYAEIYDNDSEIQEWAEAELSDWPE